MYASRMFALAMVGVMAQLGGPHMKWKGCIYMFSAFWAANIVVCLCDVISAPWW